MDIGVLGAKPLPLVVHRTPAMPLEGVMVICPPIVSVAVAEFPFWSVAVTVWALAVMAGMVNMTLPKDPLGSLVTVKGIVFKELPSSLKVITLPEEKPLPVMVTLSPKSPEAGLRVIREVVATV
jgi:hypothetical protein